jgi:hypothetical protein
MKNKIMLIGVLLIVVSSCKTIAQSDAESSIKKSVNSFNSLTSELGKYELQFIKEKNTLYFKYELGKNKRFGYKAILEDIHPLAIFVVERKNTKYLKILSIHNGKVFVREKLRGEFLNSNNTNIIEIEIPENINENQLIDLEENLKSIFVKEENETQIQLVEPPRTKNK